MREFPNNRLYYTHRFRFHTSDRDINMVSSQFGGELSAEDEQTMTLVQQRRSLNVLTAVRKPTAATMDWGGFLEDTLASFLNVLQWFVAKEAARAVSIIVEFTHVYHNDEGGEREMGLLETRVSRVVKVAPLNIPNILRHMFTTAKMRMNNSEVSGSGWVFDRFVHVMLRATTDIIINSGLSNNVVGGKTHPSYVLSEAAVAGCSRSNDDDDDDNDDEEAEEVMTTADKAFINDESDDEGDISQYRWQPTLDVMKGGKYDVETGNNNNNNNSNALDEEDGEEDSGCEYLPDNDEVVDAIDLADVGDVADGNDGDGDWSLPMWTLVK